MTRASVLHLLSSLIGFDTTSRQSNLALIDWAEDHLRALGFRTERLYDPSGQKANLWASVGPQDVPGYILSGHTDVVPIDGQDWTSEPFQLRVADGRAYGRGACDMKGFVAVCLALAPEMAAGALRAPIHLALSYDEEVGCIGVRSLVERIAELSPRPRACFVGEPTQMRVIRGHKGKRSVRAAVLGSACHSSLAPTGVNAVEWGARLVAEIRRVADELEADGCKDPAYDVPHSTAHVGRFNGGTALNIVPGQAALEFEVRTIADDDPDALVSMIVAYAREHLEPHMKARRPETGFAFETLAAYPGLNTPAEAAVVALASSLAGCRGAGKVAFGSEAGLFQHVAGVPTVVVGPGSIDQAHKADEWVELAQLDACAEFVARLVRHCRAPPAARAA